MAYGKDPKTFEELADRMLPRVRVHCADEYKQPALAFRKTILPDVNEVLNLAILQPEDYRN